MYKLGLVLSGGGTRGATHIGVLKAIHEAGIEVNLIAGCSAGALVGAFYAAGHHPDEIYTFFKRTSLFSHPSFRINHPGLMDSKKYFTDLSPHFPEDNFDALSIPLKVYSTDLLSGRLITHSSGDLIECIMASCAIPGLFTPIKKDAMLLSDGGILNVFPVSEVRKECEFILGVLITNPGGKSERQIRNTHHVLDRAFLLNIYSKTKEEIQLCDWVIDPPEIASHNMISKKELNFLYDLGYKYGQEFIAQHGYKFLH